MTPMTRRVVIILAAVALLALPGIVVAVMMPAPASTLPFTPAQDVLQGQVRDHRSERVSTMGSDDPVMSSSIPETSIMKEASSPDGSLKT